MNNDNLDRILSREEELAPSSGFASSVMDAVHQEAAAPAPIRFPWKWALPGFIACLALVMVLIARFAAGFEHSSGATSVLASDRVLPMMKQVWEGSATQAGVGWVVVVLLLSLVAMQLSMHIVGGRN